MRRRIEEVLDLESGDHLRAADILGRPEEDIFRLRAALTEDFLRGCNALVCPLCQQPVYIAGTPRQEFFFKHRHELGDCPIKTRGRFSQEEIDRMRYNGIKESERHRRLKDFIHDTLRNDPRFSDVHKETVIRGQGPNMEWRKPDVSSIFQGRPLVWEIQLSTTFHNVIVARESFYREQGTYILWVFNTFDPTRLRFTEKDIYWLNRANAFVIDERTMGLSRERGELVLDCRFLDPFLREGVVDHIWRSRDVTVGDLLFDAETRKVFHFDLDAARLKLQAELRVADVAAFERYWLQRASLDWPERQAEDRRFSERLSRSLTEPFTEFSKSLECALNGLYSAKHGVVVGYALPNLLALANNLLEYHPQHTRVFTWALSVYGRKETILQADRKGRFQKKVDRFKEQAARRDPACEQDATYSELLTLLFPEVAPYLPAKKTT